MFLVKVMRDVNHCLLTITHSLIDSDEMDEVFSWLGSGAIPTKYLIRRPNFHENQVLAESQLR